jgi:hypothetical protein
MREQKGIDWQAIILLSILGTAVVWGAFAAAYRRQFPRRPLPLTLTIFHQDGRDAMRKYFARRFGWPPYGKGSVRYVPPITSPPPRVYAR